MCEPIYTIINSKDRINTSDTSSDFEIAFNDLLATKQPKKVQIVNIKMPMTFYNVDSNNERIYWTDSTSVNITSTITNGTYTITELCSAIATKLNADKSVGDTNTYTCSVGTNTQRVNIQASGGSAFGLRFSITSQSLSGFLGYSATALSGSTSYTATNVYNLLKNKKYVYIQSNLPVKNSVILSTSAKPIFGIVPTSNFGEIVEVDNQFISHSLIPGRITTARFSIYDEDSNAVNLKGNDWSMVLAFYN